MNSIILFYMEGHNILMFLPTIIFQVIDLQFAASQKDYVVKYLFWKFPIHSDTSCKLWISWLCNDCVSIGLHATYSSKYRSYEQDDRCETWVHCVCVNLREENVEDTTFVCVWILLFLNHIIGFCILLPLYILRYI